MKKKVDPNANMIIESLIDKGEVTKKMKKWKWKSENWQLIGINNDEAGGTKKK